MDLFDLVIAKKLAGGGGGGGGGVGTLLASKSLGTVNTSSTSETQIDTITISDAANYDMFLAIVKGDSIINSRHYASASFAHLYGTSDRAHEPAGTTGAPASNRWNCIATSSGNLKTTQNGRGIYIGNLVRSNYDITITICAAYNSTQTGTINNDYSVEIYGINLYDLITA